MEARWAFELVLFISSRSREIGEESIGSGLSVRLVGFAAGIGAGLVVRCHNRSIGRRSV